MRWEICAVFLADWFRPGVHHLEAEFSEPEGPVGLVPPRRELAPVDAGRRPTRRATDARIGADGHAASRRGAAKDAVSEGAVAYVVDIASAQRKG
jgi:hypothetical protein